MFLDYRCPFHAHPGLLPDLAQDGHIHRRELVRRPVACRPEVVREAAAAAFIFRTQSFRRRRVYPGCLASQSILPRKTMCLTQSRQAWVSLLKVELAARRSR